MRDLTANSSFLSPPLGQQPLVPPPSDPGTPDMPPAAQPPTQGQTPHPAADSLPADSKRHVPMTDGTPMPCRQKNAAEFLRGRSQGVMAQYADGLFGAQQHTNSASPAPNNAEQAVRRLAEWREQAPYG